MTDPIHTPYDRQAFIKPRSQGGKFLIVCFLALLMGIPALSVFMLLNERTQRANAVAEEIGGLMGGPQTYLGPVIVVPYIIPVKASTDASGARSTLPPQAGKLIIFPIKGQATASSKSEVRSRSLFRVPVYTSDVHFKAEFDLSEVSALAKPGALLQWDSAQVLTGITDSRGARKDIVVKSGTETLILAPEAITDNSSGQPLMAMFSAPIKGLNETAKPVLEADMSFTGAQKIGIMAFAKSTEVTIAGDWNYPSFGGGFLPTTRAFRHDSSTPLLKGEENLKSGFKAGWTVPFIARGLPAAIDIGNLSQMSKSELSVTFVEPTNPYQSVGRSLKYAMLFIGLVFLAYFLFESTSKTELHPAQYILVGLAQITFYLLLLSLAEHIGFDNAFAAAASATVLLISAYVGLVFKSKWRFGAALVAFGLLYGLIYLLMRAEDLALLIGAISAFVVIAVVMILTRNINWYGKDAAKS